MARTFQALSALLGYPTAGLPAAIPEIGSVLRGEGILAAGDLVALQTLLDEMQGWDLYALQERYVELFDRSRALSLHLFEHVHGEGRDRGQAMVDLAAIYGRHGLTPSEKELPDFLPLFLEFLSLVGEDEARGLLADTAHILAALRDRLAQRGSPYTALFAALVATASTRESQPASPIVTSDPGADDLDALDADWEEAAVTFGPGDPFATGCGGSRLATRLRAAARSATDPTAS